MGINRVTLSQKLSGNPTIKTLHSIAENIGCEVGDFFTDEMTEQPGSSFTALIEYNGQLYSAHSLDELKTLVEEIEKSKNAEE